MRHNLKYFLWIIGIMFYLGFIQMYLWLYYVYKIVYQFIVGNFGPFYLIYYFDGNVKTHLTLRRYASWWQSLVPYSKGTYYIQIFEANNTYHIAFDGYLDQVDQVCACINTTDIIPQSRKNVIFLNQDTPINFDFNLLDKYKCMIEQILETSHFQPITQLGTLSKLFDIDATHVKIIKTKPFGVNVCALSDIHLDMLYEKIDSKSS